MYTSRFRRARRPTIASPTSSRTRAKDEIVTLERELLALSAELIECDEPSQRFASARALRSSARPAARFVRTKTPRPTPRATTSERSARHRGARGHLRGRVCRSRCGLRPALDATRCSSSTGSGPHGQHVLRVRLLRASSSRRRCSTCTRARRRSASSATPSFSCSSRAPPRARSISTTVMSVTADSLVQLLDVSSCFILLYDEKADVRCAAAPRRTGGASVVEDIDIPLDDDAQHRRRRRARAHAPSSSQTRARIPRARRAARRRVRARRRSCALPIVSRGRLEGVVMLDETRGPRTFTRNGSSSPRRWSRKSVCRSRTRASTSRSARATKRSRRHAPRW